MAYNPNPPNAKYIAGAGQTVFNYLFKVFQASDIVVYQVAQGDDPELAVPLILNTDYAVTINGDDGGTIILTTPAEANDSITIYRRLTLTRYVEYQQSGDLLASVLNADQDYQSYLVADLNDAVTEFLSGDAPGSSSDYVRRSGDTMTGNLEAPSVSIGGNSVDAVNYGIENGSGTNGTYTKFPDGTLICVMPTLDVTSGNTYFTFPFPFVDANYSFSATAIVATTIGENLTVSIRDKTLNDSIGLYCVRNGVLGNNRFTATTIGRWK